MRAIAPGMDGDVVAEVDRRLHDVAAAEGVRIPWAIESGSRAWGFPSPDSDYDCRFLFVRPRDAYLDPWPARDVIETPLDAVYDVNGWDLVKAVRLAVNGNATVGEWLRSPIVYDGEPAFRDALLALAADVAAPSAVARHYQHVAAQQWARAGADVSDPLAEVRLKGLLYAVRSAASLHWLLRHGPGTPPMNLVELLDQAPPAADVRDAVDALVDRKAVTRELGTGPVSSPVRRFVEAQLGVEPGAVPGVDPDRAEARARASDGFRTLLEAWAPASLERRGQADPT